jgi:hypothetical protein
MMIEMMKWLEFDVSDDSVRSRSLFHGNWMIWPGESRDILNAGGLTAEGAHNAKCTPKLKFLFSLFPPT